jgi:hypothetical protein
MTCAANNHKPSWEDKAQGLLLMMVVAVVVGYFLLKSRNVFGHKKPIFLMEVNTISYEVQLLVLLEPMFEF